MSNGFSHFVTFTLDKEKVDRYDPGLIMKRVNRILDNLVRRNGLTYILVTELHRDGAYHFHGFICRGSGNGGLRDDPSSRHQAAAAAPQRSGAGRVVAGRGTGGLQLPLVAPGLLDSPDAAGRIRRSGGLCLQVHR